jgi:cytochrome b subunit of formate dehydrogenase
MKRLRQLTAILPLLFAAGSAQAQDPSAAPPVEIAPIVQVAPRPEGATDPDNCLLCHRFPGLSRLDAETGELRLFFVSERFHADGAGPHTSLACTGCHDRAAVEKVPHEVVPSVDCGQTCHIVSGSGTAVDFSHRGPTESLAGSVHAPDVLTGQPYEQALLREGQSACLYCHDDPAYRMPAVADGVHRGVDPTIRCQTCHDDSLPVDTRHYVQHVGSRLGDQRPAREAARACAVCHSDEALIAKNESHDAVTSYMRSFHGKASTLGSLDAAVCTDCHASEDRDPHLMLASTDVLSPTHADNRQLTCRSSGCHDDAAPAISAAGVHMRISPEAASVEYYVTAAFVILTIGTMTLYFALLVLELINIVVRREDDEHLQNIALARAVQAHPEGRKRLTRLTVHQRFQHWVLVISFMALVVTGLPMKFASAEWMPMLVTVLGGLDTARLIHRMSAIVISLAFCYHIVYLAVLAWRDLARRRAELPERNLFVHLFYLVYESPMMVRPQDVKDFALLFVWLFGLRRHRPAQGKFHFSQKFEYWAVFWGMTMIGLSGAMLWMEDSAAETFGGRALNFAYIVHSDEAFLALLYISVVHFFAVVFSPVVFPLNLGSLTGDMPPGEMAENHMGHLRAVADELGISAAPVERAHGFVEVVRQIGRRSFALVQAGVIAAFGFASITFLWHEMKGGEAAVEVERVPLRLDATSLVAATEEADAGTGGASRNALDRGPLSHFHAIPTWYEQDTANTCATGGCHSALPHGDRKEVRAFLNMHTTFVDCQVCHRDADLTGTELSWLTLSDRAVREAPAVLRLAALLETPAPEGARPAPWDTEVVTTLRAAVEESGGDPELKVWLADLESSRVGGVRYGDILERMKARVDRHGHGEYGARIGITDAARRWIPNAEQKAAIDALRGEGALRIDERKTLVTTAHQNLKKPKVECALCHTTDAGLVDFAKLGYSKVRADALRSNTIARQAQAVESGETFFLPSVLGGNDPTEPPEAGSEVPK